MHRRSGASDTTRILCIGTRRREVVILRRGSNQTCLLRKCGSGEAGSGDVLELSKSYTGKGLTSRAYRQVPIIKAGPKEFTNAVDRVDASNHWWTPEKPKLQERKSIGCTYKVSRDIQASVPTRAVKNVALACIHIVH